MTAPKLRLRLGTRRSRLALAQSGLVADSLRALDRSIEVELVPIVTRGDTTPGPLAAVGGKGLFTAELETGLLDGSLDLAVHSLKDLPVSLPEGLAVAAYPEREDPRDVLFCRDPEAGSGLGRLPDGARVLTGSLRRRAQLLRHRPDLEVEQIRGNVDTRIQKWREGAAHGLVLAAAGLRRLGIEDPAMGALPAETVIPAPGQGTLALEAREGTTAFEACRALDHEATARAARAERAVVAAFGGDCTLPLAAWARARDGVLLLSVFLASADCRRHLEITVEGEPDPEALAARAVAALRQRGADALLAHPEP